ncbi:MAG: FAD-binding oxidoreductase [Pseudomonadota bacterium]
MKHEPFWWEAARPSPVEEKPLAPSCDVAVVGSGYAGLHAALMLARAGRSVQVFDAEVPGFGASSRNGGMVAGTTKFRLSSLTESEGVDKALALYREGMEAETWFKEFLQAEDINCHFETHGRFTGAYRPADFETLAREAETVTKHFDRAIYAVPRGEQRNEIGSDAYHGGLVQEDMSALHPALYHEGLLGRVLAAGAVVHGSCRVNGFHRDGNALHIKTQRGAVLARDLVVATNGYTGKELPWLRRRLVSPHSQIIATEPISGNLMAQLMPKKRTLGDTRILFPYYRACPEHRRIVFGGRAGAWSDDPEVKAKALQAVMVSIFPELQGTGLTHIWSGHVAFPFDRRPKLAVENGVHYATGFCGSGVIWASWFGHLAAKRIIGEAPVASALGSDPFQTRPLYWGTPWFLPVILGWYRLKDAV